MKNKGFTLIEIMIVIGIIVVLTMIAIAAGDSAKKVARDNQRKTDITLLQLKLESYKAQVGEYPTSLNDLTTGTSPYITQMPMDPKSGDQYGYVPLSFGGNCGESYYLFSDKMENAIPAGYVRPVVDFSVTPACVGVSTTVPLSDLTNVLDVTSPSVLRPK